jgi:hypothetical protein
MDVESDGLDVPAHPDKGRIRGGTPGMRRSSFGARASSFLSEAVGPRASMAAERVSIYAADVAKDFVSTPARRPHSSMRPVKFEEEIEVDAQPLQRTESAFMGAARVAGGQLTGDGQYGVESDTYPYVAILLVVACLGIFGWEMWENDLRFESTEINPFYGPSADVLLRLGAKRQVRRSVGASEGARCGAVWRGVCARAARPYEDYTPRPPPRRTYLPAHLTPTLHTRAYACNQL